MTKISLISALLVLLMPLSLAAEEMTPQEARHELMEGVGDAAKPVGEMLKGEAEFDAQVVAESFRTWFKAGNSFGDLFPEGSESGYDTEAKDTIWSDTNGFNIALMDFSLAAQAGVARPPQDLEQLKPLAGAVFKQCKACHEKYRVEKED